MRTSITAVVAAVIVCAGSAHAQTGLLHDAREEAAGYLAFMLRIFDEPLGPDNDWSIQDPVIDSFTDERGQTATLNGINNRMVLTVGCADGRTYAIGVGGLGTRQSQDILFQNGNIDLRWGDGSVESHGWIDSDLVLVVPDQDLPGFLETTALHNRLRIRANVTRNRFVQDEFNLSLLTVSPNSIKMVDPPQGQAERKELVCTR